MIDTEMLTTVDINNKINKMGDENLNLTPIQEFYKNSVIFMTGSTGFLGQVMLEKLLRSCPEISTIYILVRNKKGKNVESRVEEIFADVIFDRLKKECPKYKHKVVGVAGDCSLPNLGMSQKDITTLIEEVNIVFHVAATVRFDEKLKTAIAINVRATEEICLLAQKMPKLKSLMHVSTAYSNCHLQTIEEKIYPAPLDYKKVIALGESMPEKILDNITPKLLKQFPNTYTFTKQIAEDVVRDHGRDLPCGIFRPAIVISTYKEPITAWINNMYGPTGIVAGAAVGLIRTLHCDKKANATLIPVDMCVNSLIAAAWEVGTNFKDRRKNDEIPVYNYESSTYKPITWEYFMAESQRNGFETPTNKAVWYYTLTLHKYFILYYITRFFLHIVPALLVDTALVCMGKSPKMVNIYNKIHKYSSVISYFSTKSWTFKSENVEHLCEIMDKKDKEIFFCDLKKLNWGEFFESYCRGIRIYTIKDPADTIQEAKVKFNRLYWVHQATKTVIIIALFRFIWFLCSLVYDLVFAF